MQMNSPKQDIRALSLDELSHWFMAQGQPPYRAKQVYEWLWKRSARTFEQMSNLSLATRQALEQTFVINALEVALTQKSQDGTLKSAFKLFDGKVVEGVLIPAADRMTACISSQVGCSLDCAFCATGRLDRLRNLNADEMVDQVVALRDLAKQHYQRPLSNIVYMGMGEPLLNYANTLRSTQLICVELGMSPRRITVSTAGIAKMIKKLGDDAVRFNLALSLHAANDTKRSKIMSINAQNNLGVLAEALKYFHAKTSTRVTFEYIVFRDFNDTLTDAKELAEFCKNVPCKINLIEYNPIEGGAFEAADPQRVDQFCEFLETRNLVVNIRRSRGKDIDAACGQLANKG